MRTIPLPKQCGLYLPGHQVHWIQAFHSTDAGEIRPVRCRILEVDDDGVLVVELAGRPLRLWTHDPLYLRAVVAKCGVDASYQERWRLLSFPSKVRKYVIDVTRESNPDRRPCPSEPPRHDTLLAQLMETGGFSVQAADIVAASGRLSQDDESTSTTL